MAKPFSLPATVPAAPALIIAAAMVLIAFTSRAPAFVFLDTSEGGQAVQADSANKPSPTPAVPAPSAIPVPPPASKEFQRGMVLPAGPVQPSLDSAVPAFKAPSKPHYRTVVFLSAENMLVYSHLGVLKALDEFKLDVDLLVVESKSVLVGAAWSLGYPMMRLEENLLRRPLSFYLRPHREHGSPDSRFTPFGPDPVQVEIPLGLQSLQAPTLTWSEAPTPEGDEYLHLSWMIAKLTHDAPAGPVEDIREAPRPMAVQVADLQDEKGKVLLEGNLQSLLKAGLLPKDALRRRKRLWPHASGSLISGHALMSDALPFTYDRLVTVEPGRRLRPPSLEPAAEPWQDSLDQRLKTRTPTAREAGGPAVLRIELNPDAGFDHAARDPKPWIDLGYASTLRSMDVLLAALGTRPATAADASSRNAAVRSAPVPPPLGLGRLTVNPLASGGRQLLQDLVLKAVSDGGDSAGDGAITNLIQSGYYSDLDVEWVRGQGEEYPALVFDALEKSRLLFKAAANVANTGEDLPDRGPEMFAGLAWSEPFYVPFRAEAAILMGGHQPGYGLKGLIAPVYPVHLELGFNWKEWRIGYPAPPTSAPKLDPWSFRLNRRRTELFLNLFLAPNARMSTAIQKHEMTYPAQVPNSDQQDPGAQAFQSTDFQETIFLGLGRPGPSGVHRQYLWGRYRNLNRVNLFGPVKYSASSVEARLRASLGPFRFLEQYYWSNQDVAEAGIYEFMEAGEVAAWSFQDEYFLAALRGIHFQNIQAEFAPAFGKFGVRMVAGAFRQYGQALADGFGVDFTKGYWEAQMAYATPVGPLRAGLAGLMGDSPFYFVRFGADLDLEPDGPEK